MRHLIVFAIAMLAAGVCATPSFADGTPSPSPSASPKRLESVVVTALRHPAPADATSRQTIVITAGDLERLGAASAADALRFAPAAVIQQYGAYGSLETAALRGASSSQTLVLIDGQPANEADTGIFDFSSLPANVIDRIEVVEGGSSTLYGSAAMGGVINILTRHPASAGNVNAYAQVGYRGSFTRGIGFTVGPPGLLMRVDAQAASASNSFDYPAFGGFYPQGSRSNNDAKTQNVTLALSGRLGIVDTNASLSDDGSAIGAPGSVFFPSELARQQRVYKRMNVSFDVPLPRGDVELELQANGRRLHFYDPTQPFPFDTQANGSTRGAALRATIAAGRMHVVTVGLDSRGDSVTFEQSLPSTIPSVARDATNAWYVQEELHAPGAPLTVGFGLRNERFQGTKRASVPAIGALMRLSSSVDVLANYARAFRAPNLDERYFPGFGDPTLEPEYGATFDVGIRSNITGGEFSLAYFGQDTNNLIINVPVDAFGDVKPFNVSRARVRGLETSAQTALGRVARMLFSYTDFLRAEDLTPVLSGKRLLYRPTATASVAAWINRAGWDYGVDSRFVGRRFADEANTQLMPPYVVSGVHIKHRFSRRRLALTLRVDNVGNNHHAEDVLGYPVVGSALSLRLSTR